MPPILKLEMDDAGKELEFELAYQRMLTTQERRVSLSRAGLDGSRMLLGHQHPACSG